MAPTLPRIVLGLVALSLLSGVATATPPPGAFCPVGYNPTALLNVCTYQNPDVPPSSYNPGGVTTNPLEVCIIGNLCEDVPVPALTPNGPVSVPIPGRPGLPGVYYDANFQAIQCQTPSQTNCVHSYDCYGYPEDPTCTEVRAGGQAKVVYGDGISLYASNQHIVSYWEDTEGGRTCVSALFGPAHTNTCDIEPQILRWLP